MEPEKKKRVSHKDDMTPSTKKGSFVDVSKSSYEPGKVHAISFKTMEPDASKKTGLHPRKMITIYRKISEQDLLNLQWVMQKTPWSGSLFETPHPRRSLLKTSKEDLKNQTAARAWTADLRPYRRQTSNPVTNRPPMIAPLTAGSGTGDSEAGSKLIQKAMS